MVQWSETHSAFVSSQFNPSNQAMLSRITQPLVRPALHALVVAMTAAVANAQVLDKQQQLDAQTFWDNRDWDWYAEHIPFFECPDADITTTYYYRWELLTKHLTYGSPNSGYSFTEFIDRPFWSGAYGAISCPAGHQLYEARWLPSAADRPRLLAVLVPHAGCSAAKLFDLAGGRGLGRASGASRRCVRDRLVAGSGQELRGLGAAPLRPGSRPVLADRSRRRHGVQHQQPPDTGHPARRSELSTFVQRLHVGRCGGDREDRPTGR